METDTAVCNNGAQASEDGKTVVLRVAWADEGAQNVTLNLIGYDSPVPLRVIQIAHGDERAANTPSDPKKVVPADLPGALTSADKIPIPPNSYTIIVATLA